MTISSIFTKPVNLPTLPPALAQRTTQLTALFFVALTGFSFWQMLKHVENYGSDRAVMAAANGRYDIANEAQTSSKSNIFKTKAWCVIGIASTVAATVACMNLLKK